MGYGGSRGGPGGGVIAIDLGRASGRRRVVQVVLGT